MNSRVNKLHWLPAVLLAFVLGAQVAQAAHVHADHLLASDCLQCQLDTGHAVLPPRAHTPAVIVAAGNAAPAVALAPVSTCYRLAARGPPSVSC